MPDLMLRPRDLKHFLQSLFTKTHSQGVRELKGDMETTTTALMLQSVTGVEGKRIA